MAGTRNGSGRRFAPWVIQTIGVVLIVASFINSEVLGRAYHSEYLIAGVGLIGGGLAYYLDKK